MDFNPRSRSVTPAPEIASARGRKSSAYRKASGRGGSGTRGRGRSPKSLPAGFVLPSVKERVRLRRRRSIKNYKRALKDSVIRNDRRLSNRCRLSDQSIFLPNNLPFLVEICPHSSSNLAGNHVKCMSFRSTPWKRSGVIGKASDYWELECWRN